MPSYQSTLDRVGLLISANINALIDRALGANSVAVFDEYLNRMNGALDALESAEGVERGRSRTLARQIEEVRAECAHLDDDVDRLLAKGERALAAARQAVFNTKSQLLEQLSEDQTNCQREIGKLAESRAKLGAQIEVSQSKRQQLISFIEQKKAAELRYKAQAGAHVSTPDRLRVDDILEKARQELEVAEGKNEAAASTLDSRIDELLGTEDLEQQLQARETKLLGGNQQPRLSSGNQ
jgi:phage shock protein A